LDGRERLLVRGGGQATLLGEMTAAGQASIVKRRTVASLATLLLAMALPCGTWARTISTAEINAGLDPMSPGVQAFVARLRSGGIMIRYAASERRWHAGRHGEVAVSIRSLPDWATEDEMKDALRQINEAYMLSPRAHIAMSYPSYSQRAASAAQTAGDIVRLFRSYREHQ
jgi:hypothetical protein